MYSIIDIEATGGNSTSGRITEIAIYKFNGQKIIKEFSSLINPEMPIPKYVQGLTGITDSMAAEAPKFFEIAKDIVEIIDESCFVAHNVNFDYSFIKMEFKSLGYDFYAPRLCTLELSKKLLPGIASYSLGNLCSSLNIDLADRHRASGDALATVELFRRLQEADNKGIITKSIRK